MGKYVLIMKYNVDIEGIVGVYLDFFFFSFYLEARGFSIEVL